MTERPTPTIAALPAIKSAKPAESAALKKFKASLQDINLSTLKQRHDNFSFEKTLELRPLVYNSIHFRAAPNSKKEPDVLIFPKRKQPPLELSQSPSQLSAMMRVSHSLHSSSKQQHSKVSEEVELWKDFKSHFRNANRD